MKKMSKTRPTGSSVSCSQLLAKITSEARVFTLVHLIIKQGSLVFFASLKLHANGRKNMPTLLEVVGSADVGWQWQCCAIKTQQLPPMQGRALYYGKDIRPIRLCKFTKFGCHLVFNMLTRCSPHGEHATFLSLCFPFVTCLVTTTFILLSIFILHYR